MQSPDILNQQSTIINNEFGFTPQVVYIDEHYKLRSVSCRFADSIVQALDGSDPVIAIAYTPDIRTRYLVRAIIDEKGVYRNINQSDLNPMEIFLVNNPTFNFEKISLTDFRFDNTIVSFRAE